MHSTEYYNNMYLVELNEELDELKDNSYIDIKDITKDPEYISHIDFSLKKYLELRLAKPLYFTFGKYKGRIVQDIMSRDKGYCDWLTRSVISNKNDILTILDFINKNGKRYTVANPIKELKDIFYKEFKIEASSNTDKHINKLFSRLYQNRKEYCTYEEAKLDSTEFNFYDYGDDYPEYY